MRNKNKNLLIAESLARLVIYNSGLFIVSSA